MASKSRPARRPAPAAKPKPRAPAPKKPAAKSPPKRPARPAPRSSGKSASPAAAKAPAKPAGKPAAKPPAKKPVAKKPAPPPTETIAIPLRGDGRRHLLSLSFLRDGDEFLARLETDAGQITELKNRALDQLLTLVASELEDLLE
jgi:hypothetical protein